MKKNQIGAISCEKRIFCKLGFRKKILSLFLILSFTVTWSQNLNLNFSNTQLKQIIEFIETNSSYKFFYKNNDVDVEKLVSIKLNDVKISEVLNELFEGSSIVYEIDENDIILKNAKSEKVEIKGQVVDIDGNPMPGVNVLEKGTQNGTISDIDGRFTITTTSYASLKFSFMGYETQLVKLNGRYSIKVTLKETMVGVDEVVVVGYGEMKKADVSTSISVVENVSEIIENRPVHDAVSALQGAVAGVTVMNNGGDPGATPRILIRGQGNKDGDGIAYVVDGILGAPYNVNDIETITVLKDAASASIYGASAGTGGVVLITTKKAKLGKVNVNLNVQRGFQEGYNLPTALTAEEYNQVYKQAAVNSGKAEPDRTNNLLNPWGAVTRTDWMEEVFRRGLVENYGINISGGNEDLNLYASFNYQNKEGILLNTFSKKFSGKLTGVFRYNDNIKLTQTLQIRQDESRSANTTSGYSGVIVSAYYMPSSAPVYDEFGNFHGTTPSNIGYGYGDVINPVASLLRNDSENPTTNFYSSTRLELKLPLGFKFESSFAIDGYQRYYSSFSPKRLEKGKQDEENSRSMSALNNYDWVMDNVLKYDKSFLGNNISVILGYNSSYEKNQNFGLQVYGYDKEDDYYRMLGNATNWTKSPPSEGYVELSQAAMFSRLAYDYKKRYFLIASARQDKSSRLHPDYNTDEFYSFAASWNVTNESFIKSLDIDDILSYLKLRISWGQIGNVGSVPVYHYAVDASNLGDGIILGADPKVLNGVAFQKIPNEELRWETGEQIDYGFDAVLFNSLDLKFDYFKKTTKDLIDDIPQTKMQGAKYTTKGNVGEVTNSGYEISINYSGKIAEVEYAIGGNLSYVKNEVDKLGQSVILHGNDFRGLYPLQSEVGQEWYSYKLIKTDGIFQSDQEAEQYVDKNGNRIQPEAKAGDLKFVDENGDGKIDGLDKVYLGNSVPDYSYAINAKIAYKGIDFSIMLQGVAEAKIFNAMKNTTHNLSVQEYNRSNEVLNAWSPDNTGSDLPMVRLNDPNGNFSKESDFYLEDGDYLRIKNITLGYSFPKEIKDMLNLKKLRIYLSAENLATFTDYNGIDPEVGNNGIDSGRYPVAKSFLVGLNINF